MGGRVFLEVFSFGLRVSIEQKCEFIQRNYVNLSEIYMDKCGYDFVIMVKGMKSFTNEIIKKVKGTCDKIYFM